MAKGKHYDPGKFQRPGIDLDHHGRAWRDVHVYDLKPGDVVQGKGLVEALDWDDCGNWRVEYFSHERVHYSEEQLIAAFTKPLTTDKD